MTESVGWSVVLSLITIGSLITLVIKVSNAVSKPTIELQLVLRELDLTLKGLQKDMANSEKFNEKEHTIIFHRLDEHKDCIEKLKERVIYSQNEKGTSE